MLKEITQNKLDFVVGRKSGCSCCCKRNPHINYYEGIWKGYVDSESICLSICNTHKDSLGYKSCLNKDKSGDTGCSILNNTELAAEMEFNHFKYHNTDRWAKVDMEILNILSSKYGDC